MVFMVGMTLTATVMLVVLRLHRDAGTSRGSFSSSILGIMMVVEAFRSLGKPNVPPEEVIFRSDLEPAAAAAGD